MDPTNATNATTISDPDVSGLSNSNNEMHVYDDTEVLKVSAHSRPSAVAGAIAAVIRNHGRADVQAIGAGATNQAIKAVAIARDYLQPNGIDIVVVPAFIDVVIAEEERTAIRLVVEARG
jgi:stage V sporulation protein S